MHVCSASRAIPFDLVHGFPRGTCMTLVSVCEWSLARAISVLYLDSAMARGDLCMLCRLGSKLDHLVSSVSALLPAQFEVMPCFWL